MTPTSLFGHALELIELLSAPLPYPADARVGRFFRDRRYLGSKDRKTIGGVAYTWLRHAHRARARWSPWEQRESRLRSWSGAGADAKGDGPGARLAELLALGAEGLLPWPFEEVCGLISPRLAALGLEDALPETPLGDADWPEDPGARAAAVGSLPLWLSQRLREDLGSAATAHLAAALLQPAPVDLRVRLSLGPRDEARSLLARELGVSVAATPWSPAGLRLEKRVPLEGCSLYRAGRLEVEDEGSQLVALCLGARPGETVIDACAGAGGKTLALAEDLFAATAGGAPEGAAPASAASRSRLIACDIAPPRLRELRRRASRAGLERQVEVVQLAPDGPLPPGLPPADLVLVDAPCSGLGTLRRNPDLKHRYGAGDVQAMAQAQLALLARFSPLVSPGGRLAYVTCSILREENQEVAASFLAGHRQFEPLPSAWGATHLPPACQAGPGPEGSQLLLDPVRSGTDGFFLALWRRKA